MSSGDYLKDDECEKNYSKQIKDAMYMGMMKRCIDNLTTEVEQLKEALRKCNPFTTLTQDLNEHCIFCNTYTFYDDGHKPDCQYIKLTK